ncbi:hypothetical protein Tco_0472260 [Tanacetum coccineum]
MGHFARECRAPRNKEGFFKYQDNTRKQGNSEDTSSKAMLAKDGVGFDWSDMAEEQVQTNMALMAFSNSEVYNDKTCTKTCLKNYETLKKQCDDLIVKLNQTEFTAATYIRGLEILDDQLMIYRNNEVRIYQKSQENSQKQASTDTRISRVQSRSQKSQASVKISQEKSKMVELSQTQKDKSSKYFTLVPQLSQKSKNVPSSLIGPRKA